MTGGSGYTRVTLADLPTLPDRRRGVGAGPPRAQHRRLRRQRVHRGALGRRRDRGPRRGRLRHEELYVVLGRTRRVHDRRRVVSTPRGHAGRSCATPTCAAWPAPPRPRRPCSRSAEPPVRPSSRRSGRRAAPTAALGRLTRLPLVLRRAAAGARACARFGRRFRVQPPLLRGARVGRVGLRLRGTASALPAASAAARARARGCAPATACPAPPPRSAARSAPSPGAAASSVSAWSSATSSTASTREAVTFACWPPGPDDRLRAHLDLGQRQRNVARDRHRVLHRERENA